MSQIKYKKKTKASAAAHLGLMSRWADLMGLNVSGHAPEWEAHLFDRSMTILKYESPEILEAVKQTVRKNINGQYITNPEDPEEKQG